jgi:hypothetical protein
VDRVIRAKGATGGVSGTARGIRAASAPRAPGRSSHNPPVVGSSPTRPTYLTCGNVRFGPAGQHAYRMDAGVVAAMTPGRAFRRAPQAPPEALAGQARTGQARPGRAAPQSDQVSRPEAAAVRPPRSRWTRPPSSSRNTSAGASVNSSPPWGGPTEVTLGRTQRPGQRQSRPLCVTTSRAGPRPAQGII